MNLDFPSDALISYRQASNTMRSHRLVQWITKTVGVNAAEAVYAELNKRHFELGQRYAIKSKATCHDKFGPLS